MRTLPFLLVLVLVTGTPGQPRPAGEDEGEQLTCGLTRAQIPEGLTLSQANARVLALSRPKGRLAFELLEGLLWRYQLTAPYDKLSEWTQATDNLSHRLQM